MVSGKLGKWQVRIFLLCWAAYACIYFGRVNFSVAIPEIQKTFAYSKAQVGLVGSLFFWIYGIGQLVNGYIGDRVSSRILVFTGLLVTALTNIFFGLASSFIVMAVFWAVNGFFQSMLWGPIAKTLSRWFSQEEGSRVIVAVSTSMVFGYIASWGFAGQILDKADWRWVFLIPGIIIFAYSLIWYFGIISNPGEVSLESPNHNLTAADKNDGQAGTVSSLWKIICKTGLWYVVIACLAQGIIKDGITLWAPTFMMETQNLDIKSASAFIMFIPVMNFFGMILAGWLNIKLKNREKLAAIFLFCFGMLMVLGLIGFGKYGPITALAFLGLSSAFMYGANTLLLGVIPMNYAEYNKVSSIAGFLDFCSYLASGFASFATGMIVSKWGWSGVMIVWAVMAAAGIVSLTASLRSDNMSNFKNKGLSQNLQ